MTVERRIVGRSLSAVDIETHDLFHAGIAPHEQVSGQIAAFEKRHPEVSEIVGIPGLGVDISDRNR